MIKMALMFTAAVIFMTTFVGLGMKLAEVVL